MLQEENLGTTEKHEAKNRNHLRYPRTHTATAHVRLASFSQRDCCVEWAHTENLTADRVFHSASGHKRFPVDQMSLQILFLMEGPRLGCLVAPSVMSPRPVVDSLDSRSLRELQRLRTESISFPGGRSAGRLRGVCPRGSRRLVPKRVGFDVRWNWVRSTASHLLPVGY